MDYCKKPCHDCPFRADIAPYQRPQDVRNNLLWTLLLHCWPNCHHAWDKQRREVACAGGILFRRALGLSDKFPCPGVHAGGAAVFRTREEFRDLAACPQVSAEGRWWAWWRNQPRHVRVRLLWEGKHPKVLVVE